MHTHLRSFVIFTFALAAACTGRIHGEDVDPGASDGPRFARLTHAQWENTVQDLFGLPAPTGISASFQPDPPLGRFDNNILRLTVTGQHWQGYQRAAEEVAELVAGDPLLLDALLPDAPADTARAFVADFGARAFRRPLDDAEIERYAAIFAEGATHYPDQDATAAGARLVIESMLQSPFFLYRTETANDGGGGAVALSGYEIASRLSYAFWNTMPDEDLFAAARAGELDTVDGIRAQVERLFDHPRTRAQFADFHFQAFALREYTDVDKDGGLFPEWDEDLAVAMQEETVRFLDSVVFGDGGLRQLLTSNKAFVNAELAAIYGVPGEFGEDYVEVDLDPSQRAGFLTRVGFLTRNATLTEPDPIHRGVFVNFQLLCRQLGALPNLPDDLMPVGNTNRERIESITGPDSCAASCHTSIINPPGFALENYDAIGRWRDTDNGYPVDATGTYAFPDGREITFSNAIELSQQLAESPELHACYTRQMLEYLYGRDLGEGDRALAEQLAGQSLDENLTVRDIVTRVVTSGAFRFRPAAN